MADPVNHITCQEVVELVTDYLEAALPTDDAELFEQHINYCQGCEWYLAQMRTTRETVGRVEEEAEFSDEARERLLAAFRNRKRQ
jgi:anti-sigma factor RsiW